MALAVRKRRFKWLRWVIWGLVVLAIGITVLWHIFLSPARLRARVQSSLSAMVEGRVSVAGAQFALEHGIVIKGIRIEDPDSKFGQPVVEIETLTLRPRWGPLLKGSLVLKGIILERPHVILELDEAGHWPFQSRIHPPKGTGGTMPRVDVSGGEILISNLGPQKLIPDVKLTGIEGNIRAWGLNAGAWWSDIDVPDSVVGKIHAEIHNSGLNGQVQGKVQLTGIKLGKETRALLPPSAHEVWDSFAPGGTVDVKGAVTWDPAAEPPLKVEGDAQLNHASMRIYLLPHSTPIIVSDIAGGLDFNLKEVRTKGVTGRFMDAPFAIAPSFASLEENGPFELSSSAYGCKIEGLFKDLVPKEGLDRIPDWLKDYLLEAKVSGKVDGSFKLSRAQGAKEIQSSAEVSARDLTLSDGRLGYPLILNTTFRYSGDTLAFSQASANWGGAKIEMSPATFNLTEGAAMDISARISDLELDRKLHDLLPEKITKNLDENGASGNVDASFHLERAEGAAAPTHWRALVYLRDGRASYVDFPYPIEHLFGQVEFADDGLKNVEFSGMNGPSQIGITESFDPYKGMPGRLLIIRAMGGVFNQDLRNAMPPSCLKLWDSLKPQGTINMNLAIQFWQDPKFPDEKSEFTFDATLPKFSLEAGIPLQLTVANITIEEAKEDSPGKLFIHGRFNVAQAGFAGVQLAGLHGTYQSRDGLLRLQDIAADCFGGRLTGSLAIRGGADEANLTADEFRGELYLSDANVRDIIQGTDIKGMSGRLNATSTFSGSLSNPEDFRATGAMTILQGKIGAQPGSVVLSALNLLQLKNPSDAPFHDVQLEFEMKGSAVYAKEFNFIGNLLSLYGSGSLGTDGKNMNLKFTPTFGPQLPKIPVLSQILDVVTYPIKWLKGKVIPVSVAGDFSDPVVRMNPALSLTRFIQSGIAQLVPLNFLKPKTAPESAPAPAKQKEKNH